MIKERCKIQPVKHQNINDLKNTVDKCIVHDFADDTNLLLGKNAVLKYLVL